MCILSKLGTCTVDVPGIRLTELKHAIGLTKLNYMELGHAAVGDLGTVSRHLPQRLIELV